MRNLILAATGVSAFCWAVVRAAGQSVTIDEAETYLTFVNRGWEYTRFPASNNHVLNSMLMYAFTGLFGVSDVTARAPALLGCAVYIAASFLLAREISERPALQLSALALLVFNPLIGDFMVAARGYSLATGFMLMAVALLADDGRRKHVPSCIASSVCLALSFAANFSFAFVNASLLVLFLVRARPLTLRIAAAFLAPGAVVTAFIVGPTLLRFPRSQLYYGATSVVESVRSIVDASLYKVNVPGAVGNAMTAAGPFLLALLGLLLLMQALWFARTAWWRSVGAVAAGGVTLSLLIHVALFYSTGLLLPKERTGIYWVPLATLAVAAAAAAPARQLAVSKVMIVLMFALAGYYLACLRVSHFKEWYWDADVREAYRVMAGFNHRCGINSAFSGGLFAGPMNYYRHVSGRESFPEFEITADPVPGRDIYVLLSDVDGQFIAENDLWPVFKGANSTLVVALTQSAAAACGAKLPAVAGEYDDIDPRVRFAGQWRADRQFREAAGGTITYSNRPGDVASIHFRGQRVALVFTRAPNRGRAEVLIDGQRAGTVDMYSPETEWRARTTFDGLPPGDHLLQVRVLKDKHPASADSYVDVDRIVVE